MLKRLLNIRLSYQFFMILVLFILIRAALPGNGLATDQIALFTSVTFLFSIYIGFAFSSAKSKYGLLIETNRSESAMLQSLYAFSKLLSANESKSIHKLLDQYLMEQVDYRMIDYQKSDSSFEALANYIIRVSPTSDESKMMKDKMLTILPTLRIARNKIGSLLSDRMVRSEWITLSALYFSIIVFLSNFKTPSSMTIFVGALVTTSVTMLVLNLIKFDNFKFSSNQKIWAPLERLFTDLDLLPYYPSPVIDRKELVLEKGKRIRVAFYPHPYPDISDKKVKEIVVE